MWVAIRLDLDIVDSDGAGFSLGCSLGGCGRLLASDFIEGLTLLFERGVGGWGLLDRATEFFEGSFNVGLGWLLLLWAWLESAGEVVGIAGGTESAFGNICFGPGGGVLK